MNSFKKISAVALSVLVLNLSGCNYTDTSVPMPDFTLTTTPAITTEITTPATTTEITTPATTNEITTPATTTEITTPATTTEITTPATTTEITTPATTTEITTPATTPATTPVPQEMTDIEKLLSQMTLTQKVYQMFVVTPEDLSGERVTTRFTDSLRSGLLSHPVGGIIMMGQNIESPEQITAFISDIQSAAEVPLFICVDEEGGNITRIARNARFNLQKIPPMSDISTKDDAYFAGEYIGSYLKKYGFNVDLAPVADTITNPENKVIGNRSFGTDAFKVRAFAVSYSDGLHKSGVLSTFKHFPNHGCTAADSHYGLSYSNDSYETLKSTGLVPFAAAESAGVDFVMSAHITLPNITGNLPCTLSYKALTEILRGDLGYNGIIITDGMKMKAISDYYGAEQSTVMAIKAGADIILGPANLESSANAVIAAVQNGEISVDRIDASVRRILSAKQKIA